jgi:hypothetical protein
MQAFQAFSSSAGNTGFHMMGGTFGIEAVCSAPSGFFDLFKVFIQGDARFALRRFMLAFQASFPKHRAFQYLTATIPWLKESRSVSG